jgi:hypothetical protein
MPSPDHIRSHSAELRAIKGRVATLLKHAKLAQAVELVDEALLSGSGIVDMNDLKRVREAHASMTSRRVARGRSGR